MFHGCEIAITNEMLVNKKYRYTRLFVRRNSLSDCQMQRKGKYYVGGWGAGGGGAGGIEDAIKDFEEVAQ